MIKEIDKKNELTDLKIKHLKPTIRIEKDGSEILVVNQISDTKIKGLYLTVKPNNKKLWEFRYTSPTKKNRRRTSFGNYPDISLLKAREIGQKYRELIANNIDPIDNKKEELKLIDLNIKGKIENAISEWLKKESLSTTETTHKSKKMIFNYVMEFFRKENIIYVNEIKLFDITKLLQEKEKTAPETASKLFNYIGNFFKFCVLKGYCESNLILNIRKKDVLIKKEVMHMPKITDIQILKKLVVSIYSNEDGTISIQNALKLVLHLPLRPENLANLKWEYINFENKTLIIPRAMMKVKNKNLPDFFLPLTDNVIEILLNQKQFLESFFIQSEYVFVGKDLNLPINKESTNKALKRLGFNDESKGEKIRTHGFRGIFRSMIDTTLFDNKLIRTLFSKKKHNPIDVFIGSKNREEYSEIVFQDIESTKPYQYNLFRGFPFSPIKKVDTSLFWNFVKEVICNNDEFMYAVTYSWMAQIIQTFYKNRDCPYSNRRKRLW